MTNGYAHPDIGADHRSPHYRDSERAILGALMRGDLEAADAAEGLLADDYYIDAHTRIFRAIQHAIVAGLTPDLVTVAEQLTKARVIDDVGNGYLAELVECRSGRNAKHHAANIKDAAARRELIHQARAIIERVADPTAKTTDIIADSESFLKGIGRTGSAYQFTTSADLANGDYRPKWLVRRLFVEGMPGILGGPKKALKTSLLIDLAISIATQTPFLGEFDVMQRCRVALLSGESGEHTLRETALRICAAKGVEFADVDVVWGFTLPQLANVSDLADLKRGLKDNAVKVLIVDPVYLCLLAGGSASDASNLFAVGPILMNFAHMCRDIGVTPLLAHHARKNLANAFDPLELEDLAFAGFAEFARQWLLINRASKYEPGTGHHQLYLTAGGSIGHGGLWALDINEGVIGDEFGGRRWEVEVLTSEQSREAQQGAKADKQAETKSAKDKADDAEFLLMVDRLDPRGDGFSFNKVKDAVGWSGTKAKLVLARLTFTKAIEEISGFKVGGKLATGIRRPKASAGGSDGSDSLFGRSSERSGEVRTDGHTPL